MAICRCENHGIKSKDYVCFVYPIAHPSSGLICGRKHCPEPGVVYLDEKEKKRYDKGEDIFKPKSNTSKFRVQLSNAVPYRYRKPKL